MRPLGCLYSSGSCGSWGRSLAGIPKAEGTRCGLQPPGLGSVLSSSAPAGAGAQECRGPQRSLRSSLCQPRPLVPSCLRSSRGPEPSSDEWLLHGDPPEVAVPAARAPSSTQAADADPEQEGRVGLPLQGQHRAPVGRRTAAEKVARPASTTSVCPKQGQDSQGS